MIQPFPSARPLRLTAAVVLCATACRPAIGSTELDLVGVIEGFYGPPWSYQDRLDIIAFMGRVGLRDYVYAPKDDPYHRSEWRAPYPPDEWARLDTLVQTATAHDVRLWYAISPGLSIRYTSDEDYEALLAKIDAVTGIGVRHVGLFLDDVPPELVHDEDRAAYETLADAHVALTNRLHADLTARGVRLAFTPTTYTDAWGNPEYVATVGRGVHPDVPIVWTGPDVASPVIDAARAKTWGAAIGRPPLLWDNYPVNDFARWRLFVGPVSGRTADLPGALSGFIANPMNEAHASMIALTTLATYTADPAGYDPDAALRAALDTLYGADAEALEPFVRAFGDYAWDDNIFEPLYMLRDTIEVGRIAQTLDDLERGLVDLERRGTANASLRPLVTEFRPIVSANRNRLDALRADASYVDEGERLVYRAEQDRLDAEPAAGRIDVDGSLDEWAAAGWHALHTANGPADGIRVAFRSGPDAVYVAAEVRAASLRPNAGDAVGEGDHVALIVDGDLTDGEIGPRDLYVLVGAPLPGGRGATYVGTLRFEGFMSKWLADNRNLTFTEFHLSTFGGDLEGPMAGAASGVAAASARTARGYGVEIAIPRMGRDRLRFSLTVATTEGRRRASLARRNYPTNPETYVDLRFPN